MSCSVCHRHGFLVFQILWWFINFNFKIECTEDTALTAPRPSLVKYTGEPRQKDPTNERKISKMATILKWHAFFFNFLKHVKTLVFMWGLGSFYTEICIIQWKIEDVYHCIITNLAWKLVVLTVKGIGTLKYTLHTGMMIITIRKHFKERQKGKIARRAFLYWNVILMSYCSLGIFFQSHHAE